VRGRRASLCSWRVSSCSGTSGCERMSSGCGRVCSCSLILFSGCRRVSECEEGPACEEGPVCEEGLDWAEDSDDIVEI
jgi:hypothetical protein